MNKKEYFDQLDAVLIDKKKVEIVCEAYGTDMPEIIQKIISKAEETIFLGDGVRILAFDEIVNAEKYLHVEFKNKKIVPIADCSENDFVVYHFDDSTWSKFNIIDETVFKRRDSILELMF